MGMAAAAMLGLGEVRAENAQRSAGQSRGVHWLKASGVHGKGH